MGQDRKPPTFCSLFRPHFTRLSLSRLVEVPDRGHRLDREFLKRNLDCQFCYTEEVKLLKRCPSFWRGRWDINAHMASKS